MKLLVYIFSLLITSTYGQTKGYATPNSLPSLAVDYLGSTLDSSITLDANWRWLRKVPTNNENCFSGTWNPLVCTDPVECNRQCALEGVSSDQYSGTYGISIRDKDTVTLKYITYGPYGRSVGSRIYIMDPSKEKYLGFNLLGKEISITVDISRLPCGLNGAVYLAEMPLDGGLNSLNNAGAPFGTGYGDAQCPTDIKFINGLSNLNSTGACSNEIDLWEANAYSTAFTLHPCSIKGTVGCSTPETCGNGNFRYKGVCDKDGGDYNPYRFGVKNLYGKGSQFQVDSSKPFEMITQFITDTGMESGKLIRVVRLYKQNGKTIQGGELTDSIIRNFKSTHKETDHYSTLGGLKTMEESLRRKHVLVLSLWDDSSPAQMRWLDSVYPVGSSKSSDQRGPCSVSENRDVEYLRNRYQDATVSYGKIKVRALSTQAPTPKPTPKPTASGYWKCTQCSFIQ